MFDSRSIQRHTSSRMLLANKFRGCLLGAVVGDCLGSPFEYMGDDATADELNEFFHAIDLGQPSMRSSYQYTDDTAMIFCIAESFISKGTFDLKDVAKRFVDEYYSSVSLQGEYGCHVRTVFAKLRSQNFQELFKPASEQFNGTGSYGNGGAMRVAPVALFCNKDFKHMLHVAEQITQITHTHPLGINGALLQCLAVHQALTLDPAEGPLDVNNFVDDLIMKMQDIEKSNANERPYHEKLEKIKILLSKEDVDIEMVKKALGNNISAYGSVPIAIYSFLRAQKPIPKIEQANTKFRRTIHYAIFCGGDTDTIACMAGAIAGAYFGEDQIEESLRRYCGGVKRALELADKLSELDSLK